MEPISRDKVLGIVRMRGPLIPTELKRALGEGDTMLLGAVLSELASKGLVKISKTKIGGSPFYYDPGQPQKLERAAEHLGEKDQRTWRLLKEKQILRDDQQEALTRVSLRNIKDFAIPLQVNAPEGAVTYWKYYLLSDQEAEELIKADLGMAKKETPEEEKKEPEKAPEPVKEEKEEPAPTPPEKTPPATPTTTVPESSVKEEEKEKSEPPIKKEGQQSLPSSIDPINDEFYKQVRAYFDKQGITITEQHLVRKGSEIDLIILLPTPVGNVEYYCKAKSKKKSNDGDLASAKLQGQARNLPVLYLTSGEITKKAEGMLAKEFKGLVVKQLRG